MKTFTSQEEALQEGIIPMNYNFNQFTQQKNQQSCNLNDISGYNPMVNLNDPVVKADMERKRKQRIASDNAQKLEQDKRTCIKILEDILKAVDNLLKGNSRKGFTYQDSLVLLNSIKNKANEILNSRIYDINNDVICDMVEFFQKLYSTQYNEDCIRYNLEYPDNTVSFNTNEGIVKFNPHGLYDIVYNWIGSNQVHGRNNDVTIYD